MVFNRLMVLMKGSYRAYQSQSLTTNIQVFSAHPQYPTGKNREAINRGTCLNILFRNSNIMTENQLVSCITSVTLLKSGGGGGSTIV